MSKYIDLNGTAELTEKVKAKVEGLLAQKADITSVPTNVSDLVNDSGFIDNTQITSTIDSSSTNQEVPGAQAVYQALEDKQGTLTAGAFINIANNVISTIGETVRTLSGNITMKNIDTGVYKVLANTNITLVDDPNLPQLVTYTPSSDTILITNKNNNTTYYYLFENYNNSNRIYYGFMTSSGTGFYHTLYLKDIKTEAFTGTDGTTAGAVGLVPAPATGDAGKFLSADGTWQTASGGSTITYGTTDLTPGVSPLADGEFYFVYE